MLNKKAEKVMQIIQNIFGLVLKFGAQLSSGRWRPGDDGELRHSHVEQISKTHEAFKEYSAFLFKGEFSCLAVYISLFKS